MAKNLKVLSINFPFKTAWVTKAATLATPLALFDFDVVVIRPYLLLDHEQGGPWSIASGPYHFADREMSGKREDIAALLRQGGTLVVILDAVQWFKFNTAAHTYTGGGTTYTLTNYDFLDDHFFDCLRNGIGTRFEILNASEPFSKVLSNSTLEWTAFLTSRRLPSVFGDTVFFARNGERTFVGGHLALGEGNVVFLPNFKTLNEEQFFEACREYRYHRTGSPAPEWCKPVSLPGALEANETITKIEGHLREVQRSLEEATTERDELLAYKKLLYEKGKTQLEPIVRKALDKLGFGTTPGEIISGTGFEIDGRTTVGPPPGILEIKGSKKQITLDEFSPFIPKILADFQVKGSQSKGILIGNGSCEAIPIDRLGEKTFSSHVLDAAKTQSIVLVNSVELYCVLCGVLSGDVTDLAAIREKILTTNGFVSLLDYCNGLPFSAP